MKIRNGLAICLAIVSLTMAAPIGVYAQAVQTKEAKRAQEVKTKIRDLGTGQSAVVKVKLYSGTKYEGYVQSAGENDFVVVTTAGQSNTIAYSDVKSIGGKNMSTGAKIAIGVGIGAGVTLLVLYLVFKQITENN